MTRIAVFLCCIFNLFGCISNDSLNSGSNAETNVNNLARISLGMSTEEVITIMHPPYDQEQYVLGGDTYDIWFYVTNPTALGQKEMKRLNLTPLTFKNETLISMRYDYYKAVLKTYETSRACPGQTKEPKYEKPTQIEDEKLEESLKKLSMNSQPKKDTEPKPKTNGESDTQKSKKPSKPDKEDENMIEMESEQNFDYW